MKVNAKNQKQIFVKIRGKKYKILKLGGQMKTKLKAYNKSVTFEIYGQNRN